jgi:hypothetical protein
MGYICVKSLKPLYIHLSEAAMDNQIKKSWVKKLKRVLGYLMNIASERLCAQLQLAALEPADAYRHKDDLQVKIGLVHWLRNPLLLIGDQGGDIDYKAYAFRVLDINLGITLLNASAAQPIGNADPAWLASIHSPYGQAAGHASINKDGWLCLPRAIAPKEDSHPLDGCIPWSKDVVSTVPAAS